MPFELQHLFLAFLVFQAPRILGKSQRNSSKLISDFKFNNSDPEPDSEEIEDWESNNYYYYDDNDYENYNQDRDYYEGHRNLVTREAVYDSRKYVNSCDKSVLMKKNKKIRIISAFRGKKQYFPDATCDWNFLGSSECSPKISCSTIDLRTTATCDEDYLLIFDGVSGGLKLCGENSDLNKAKKSKQGSALFVIFKSGGSTNFVRLFKGIECVVSCDNSGDAEPLPEIKDLFKRETGCECGISEKLKASRIVGGEDAKEFEFPWLVGIVPTTKRTVYCGGSLINSNYILTASHCFAEKGSTNKTVKVSKSEIMVHMHDQHKTDADEKSLRVKVQRVICHPFYGHDIEYDNDVCLLELETPVDIVNHRPICLPLFSMDWSSLNGTDVIVSGWGKLVDQRGAAGATVLQKVTVPMLNKTACEGSYKDENITSQMMCAGYPEGQHDACQGDSGGPLMLLVSDTATQTKREQIGVVSWGYGCAQEKLPGMYANVAVLLPWIRRTAMSGTWCVEGDRPPKPPAPSPSPSSSPP